MSKLTEHEIDVPLNVREVVGEPDVVNRIAELGIVPGRQILILQKLPFAGPFIIKVRSTFVSLRREEAETILVAVSA